MAAVTETLRLDHSFGSLKGVSCRIATLTDTETWATGLGTIVWVGITDEDAAAAEEVGCTFSGGTVTFQVESGTPAVKVLALGY
jgi:hypothetical protein